jgi:hypothetical protein
MSDIKGQSGQEVSREWYDRTLEYFKNAIDRTHIGSNRGELYDSIKGQIITGAGGDIDKVIISFAMHGRFVDMGVGKGRKLGTQRDVVDTFLDTRKDRRSHKPHKWYSPTLAGRVKTLRELMMVKYGYEGVGVIEESLK